MTTRSLEELPKCPGPERCPLRVKHHPNGIEFSLGCSLCIGTTHVKPIQVGEVGNDEKEAKEVLHL